MVRPAAEGERVPDRQGIQCGDAVKVTWEHKWRRLLRHQVLLVIILMLLGLSGVGCPWLKPKEPPKPPPPPPEKVAAPDAENAERLETLLKAAVDKVKSAKDFHCLLVRQEVVGDKLRPVEELDFYQRFNPHSLKLEWVGQQYKGRKIIYVAGANDDKVLVQAGGLAGALTGWISKTLRFELTSSTITSQSRYPPDVAGYDHLVTRVREIYTEVRKAGVVVKAFSPVEKDGRKIQRFDLTVDPIPPEVITSKMILWIDLDSSLPVHTMRYDRSGRMIEEYDWRNIKFDTGLKDADFTFE